MSNSYSLPIQCEILSRYYRFRIIFSFELINIRQFKNCLLCKQISFRVFPCFSSHILSFSLLLLIRTLFYSNHQLFFNVFFSFFRINYIYWSYIFLLHSTLSSIINSINSFILNTRLCPIHSFSCFFFYIYISIQKKFLSTLFKVDDILLDYQIFK